MISLQSSLGIQFGRDYLLLVYLKKSLQEIALDAHAFLQVPTDLPHEDRDRFLSQEIAGFLKEKNIAKDNVRVGLPRNEFLLRFIVLPVSAEENLRDVIRYELEKYFPFTEEEVYFDFLPFKREPEAQKRHVLLAVIKKPIVERYLAILANAGIAPFSFEVSATAFANFFLLGQNGAEKKPAAIVNIEQYSFEVHWIGQGRLHYSRATDFNSGETNRQVTQINEEIRNGFRVGFPGQVFGEEEEEGASAVFLSGDGTRDDFIAQLARNKEIVYKTFPPEAVYSCLKFESAPSLNLGAGIGLALKGIVRAPIEVNLLPPRLRQKIRRTGVYLCFILCIVTLVLTLMWGISAIVQERLELRRVEREIAALKADVLAVQKTQKEAQDMAGRMEQLNSIQRSECSKLEILKELSRILPSSVWITELRYNKNELNLAGFAASASGIIGLLGGSPLFETSEFTAPITKDLEGKESFRIKTKIRRG